MRFVIDRFEGEYAVCECLNKNEICNIEKAALPEGAEEGSVILLSDGVVTLDKEATQQRAKKIKGLMDTLWE